MSPYVLGHFSRVRLFVTLWTTDYQAPLSLGFSRQGYWSGLPFPSPGDLPDPGIKPGSSVLQADSLLSEPPGKPEVSVNILLILTLHRKEGERERRKEKSERRHEYRRVDEELKGL